MKKLKRVFAMHFNWTTGLTSFCFVAVAGLFYAKNFQSVQLEVVLIFGLLSMLSIRNRNIAWMIFMILFGLSLGLWRGDQFQQSFSVYDQIYGKKVIIIAEARSDGVYDDKKQLEFEVGDVYVPEEDLHLPGKMTVSGFGAPAVTRGDIIQAEGKVYQTRGGRVGRISFAEIEVVNKTDSLVEKIRQNFVAGVYNALPEPAGSFALGLLIGQRSTLPDSVDENFKKVGLVHIVAVSGYNLTILVLFARRLLEKSSKYQATLLASGLIVGFLLITGFSASIVRASIVSALSLLTWYVGRSVKPLLLIGLTAVITGLWNPIYVWFDIGWYLSFLAFFGVLVLSPLLILRYSKSGRLLTLKQLISDTFSAQILTLPIIMFIFGRVSLVGFLVNIIVVPLVPLTMLFSFIAGIAGMLSPQVAGILALPAKVMLVAILDVANLFAQIPRALIDTKISLAEMLFAYILIIVICLILYHKTKNRRDIIDLEKELL